MTLIFGHQWLDLWQVPDLLPQRGGIVAAQFPATATTALRLASDDVVALIGRNQGPLVLFMPRLAAGTLITSSRAPPDPGRTAGVRHLSARDEKSPSRAGPGGH